ncbi:MAG: HypC/HybG/HupF family hydrogenase formation chaperone [Selenomonadaceae bacterium]|nr:HypC/HybG/HupF family hydrogenase formation chaperone [Selenomonadaceae bacterium]
MCLAVPARISEINGALAKVERKGVERDVSLMLLPDAKVGDYVLVHAGFAMEKVSKTDSDITDALLAEMQGAPRTVSL